MLVMLKQTSALLAILAVGSVSVSAWTPVTVPPPLLGSRLTTATRSRSRSIPLTSTSTTSTSTTSSTRLYGEQQQQQRPNEQEKLLRKEIEARNSVVNDEEFYAVADGSGLENSGVDQVEADTVTRTSTSVSSLYAVPPNGSTITSTETGTGTDAAESTTATAAESTTTAATTASATLTAAATDTDTATETPTATPPVAHAAVTKVDKNSLAARMERLIKPRAYPLFMAEKAVEFVEATAHDFAKAFTSRKPNAGTVQGWAAHDGDNAGRERVVILGTGWGAASYLKDIDNDLYDVTVISPRNYFLFTPMLAGASVGTVEYRSICEPIRDINIRADFLEATARFIDNERNTVTCEAVVCDGNSCEIQEFVVDYDRLIVTVGAQTNTYGIPGVREHCNFLKQVEDARRVRNAIVNCFERANLPNMTDEERKQRLTFAVIGAGPTGIEFAAELRDFVEQDGPKYYPNLLKFVRIKVIEASSSVLAPFDKSLQEEAVEKFNRKVALTDPTLRVLLPESLKLTELLLDSSVKEVTENKIYLNDGSEIPYGLSVWAAGNGPIPLTLQLIEALGEEQAKEQDTARGRVAIDPWMRTIGSHGKILAFGDCTAISKGQLPATAQVASQQGEYLAKMMNRKFDLSPEMSEEGIFPPPVRVPAQTESSLSDVLTNFATNNDEFAKPFQFLNLGILAYTGGGSALAQVPIIPDKSPIKSKGQVGNLLWKSVYLSKQVSWRNRFMVINDWTRRQLFGRDVTRM
jgi:NADH dehydrogenase FAD-containing subunit